MEDLPVRLPAAPLLKQLSLRSYQSRAIDTVRRYIYDFRGKKTNGAALVQMPTGSGKSGIIAVLARCIPDDDSGCVLILAPRIALRRQLALDLRGRFFDNLDKSPDPETLPKQVIELDGAIPSLAPLDYKDYVFVSTIQMLDSLRKAADENRTTQASFYSNLKEHVNLLIVDEGHYEPALSWGKSIRKIQAPKVLFTATPYRNDLKAFDVDLDHWSYYTYIEARNANFLRDVCFEQRTSTSDPNEFIDDVLTYYDTQLGNTNARVIIRCDDEAAINHMATILRNRGRTFVAIHENFRDKSDTDWQRQSVPDPKKEKEYFDKKGPIFWIHQFKLLEGIDHPQFRLLALFGEPLRNTRSLVQQIGRVVRNPDYPESAKAFVLDHTNGEYERRWEAFLEYDRRLQAFRGQSWAGTKTVPAAGEHHPLKGVTEEKFVDDVMKAHPDPVYIDGTFRRRLEFAQLNDLQPREEVRLPLTANFFTKTASFSLSAFGEAIGQMLHEKDRCFHVYDAEFPNTIVFVYFSLVNAPFLSSKYFLECSPGLIVIHEMNQLLAFYDSGGYIPQGQTALGVGPPPKASRMNRVFRRRENSRVVRLTLKNANLGHRAIRWKTFSAASIRETIPSLDDYGQVVSTVLGYSDEDYGATLGDTKSSKRILRRRYLGFANGRITQDGERQELEAYINWVREVAATIEGRRKTLAVFDRYAREEVSVANTDPRNVLVDVFEVENDFRTVEDNKRGIGRDEIMLIEDRCQDIEESKDAKKGERFSFQLKANPDPARRPEGIDCRVFIAYDEERRRYKLQSSDLDGIYYRKRGGNQKLVQYLNEQQSFRILPKAHDIVYVDGGFYRIALPVGKDFREDSYHVGHILRTSMELKEITSEKGVECKPDGSNWDERSLFGIISRLGRNYGDLSGDFGNPDIVVCDDMGTEVADFILADSQLQRVVFIHAKGLLSTDKLKKYSASKLADVCSQAIKNIHYLSMFNEFRPKKLKSWLDPWVSNHVTGSVKNRILRYNGKPNPNSVWSDLYTRIANPLTRREVWLFLGGILSKKALEKELKKGTAEAVQAVMQLQSTMAAVGSIEAKLRVFCSP